MLKYMIRRVLLVIPTLFFVALIVFALAHAAPGGPWDDKENSRRPAHVLKNLNEKYGLDKPLPEQFVTYLWSAVRGDFGVSLRQPSRSVAEIIGQALPVSAQLGVQAVLLAVMISIPLGVISALRQNTAVDYGSLLFATAGVSIPSFVLAIFAIYLLVLQFHVIPSVTWKSGQITSTILPTMLLAIGSSAFLARLTRSSMLEAIRQDYVRTARSKGLREQVVIVGHVLRNALIPVATVLGPATAAIVTGTFFIEQIFAIPGLGRFFVISITARDYPMIMGVYLLYAFVIAVANLTVDLVYSFLDPRIRVS